MKTNFKSILMLAVVLATVFSCKNKADKKDKDTAMNENEHRGINLKYMDTTTSPQQNFYNYVNGSWMKTATIPEDRTSWGSFQLLRKKTNDSTLSIIERTEKGNNYKSSSDQAKVLDIYKSELDTTARNKAGLEPLQPTLDKIKKISDLKSLQQTMAENPIQVANPFYGIYASAKPEESDMNGAYLVPGSLGLPNRGYYVKTDSASAKIREQYVDHIARMFGYLGDGEKAAHQKGETILALETKLAKPRLTKVERRDFRKLNNPRSIAQIQDMTPAIDWKQWISDLSVKKDIDTLIVTQPAYMEALQNIMTSENIDNLKLLVRWQTLNQAAGELNTTLEKTNWDFYSKTLNGAKKQRPDTERALSTVNGRVGEALGKIYVDEMFPPEAKKQAETMIQNIIATYKDRIGKLEWMTDSTKQRAVEKLNKLTIKIGYPDKWKDYSNMKVNADNTYYQNLMAASEWHHNYNLSKINKPVDKTEWGMNPQTVNAYYNPSMNEIVFPAAILQPPFYDYKADPAVNYGGVGAVIGHEISHAFDDSGARFDADGNLHNWWTKEDKEKFEKRTKALADLYSSIDVGDSLHINGEYTLGENTADLGGVLAAYYGLQRYYKTHENPGKIDGFTQNQRFFMSWATVWRTKTRPEALKSQVKNDPHSPGMYRAYVPLQNVDAFYKAFNIKKGDSMYVAPKDRVKIW